MRIYDTFTFFNELELLEIRLNILDEVVDCFVITEATRTFQGGEKPLIFADNKHRFTKFQKKIRHVVVDDMPDSSDPFVLEAYQRNAIARGLAGCQADDQIILSDLDEIPSPEKVKYAAHREGLKLFEQALYYYFVNRACVEMPDLPHSAMIEFKEFRNPQELRDVVWQTHSALLSGLSLPAGYECIEEAGWHFSYLGGVAAIREKLRAFSHSEYNADRYLDAEHIKSAIEYGADLFGRDLHFRTVPFDDRFPKFLRENRQKFEHLIDDEVR